MKKLLLNPAVALMTLIIYLGVIGPALFSAKSDAAVTLGIAILVGLGYWMFKAWTAFRSELRDKSNNKDEK